MDTSVLCCPKLPTDYCKHDLAKAGGHSVHAAIGRCGEDRALDVMSDGACMVSKQLLSDKTIVGALIPGGTMGTDLALDVCAFLPIGVAKYVVSTVSVSSIISAEC